MQILGLLNILLSDFSFWRSFRDLISFTCEFIEEPQAAYGDSNIEEYSPEVVFLHIAQGIDVGGDFFYRDTHCPGNFALVQSAAGIVEDFLQY